MTEHLLFINGRWKASADDSFKDVLDPATELTVARVSQAQPIDVDQALTAAQSGFEIWRNTSPWERSRLLSRVAELLNERTAELAHVMSLEQGKPLNESILEIERTVETFQWCASESIRSYGRVLPQREMGMRQVTVKQPIGVVACFSPWNFPAVLTGRKIAAALGAGCAVIIKPSELAPGIAVGLVKACVDAGLPDGVLNLLLGNSAMVSERLISSPIVRKVSLTGSVPVGRQLSALAGMHLKPVTMELGGHAPVLVFDDANVAKAAELTAAFKFRNTGQVCLGVSRVFVQRAIYDEFVSHFVKAVEHLKVGPGLEADTTMGPMATLKGVQWMEELVQDACQSGGQILFGGSRGPGPGFFYNPTVMTDVPDHAKLMTEEPFGPVVPLVSFETYEEAIRRANSLDLGLAAYAFTGSLDRAQRVSDDLDAGWIGVNNFSPALAEAPFGGTKDSGIGYEGGPEGFDAYCKTKFVSQSLAGIKEE